MKMYYGIDTYYEDERFVDIYLTKVKFANELPNEEITYDGEIKICTTWLEDYNDVKNLIDEKTQIDPLKINLDHQTIISFNCLDDGVISFKQIVAKHSSIRDIVDELMQHFCFNIFLEDLYSGIRVDPLVVDDYLKEKYTVTWNFNKNSKNKKKRNRNIIQK